MADLCHFYPGYTVAALMETPLPIIKALYDRIPEFIKIGGD